MQKNEEVKRESRVWKIVRPILFFLIGFMLAWALSANEVLGAPLVESGGTITASVGGSVPVHSSTSGGGGGGSSRTTEQVNVSLPASSSCTGIVYGYPVGTHICKAFNNCSVPKGLQVVSKCPYDAKVVYDGVCTGDTCQPQVVEKVVERIVEVEVPVNDTFVAPVVVNNDNVWWVAGGLGGLVLLLILVGVITTWRERRKKKVDEAVVHQSVSSYREELDAKIEAIRKGAKEDVDKRMKSW